ncbi:phosphopantothenoylcysteine decarboxylase [Kwoniella mangroviensis CBS 10435]|uniref:Phosphopantothenoylcysteine decarboxylase n=1 Tax=Kwoniella mangroviensis CBS 10435 TaxID=1331196 RepID=A0A1B9IZ14_9TREE|nr:phosphopantothenoylcysteine decarboxylase [Kwoniella mangroviensis CBS 10435]
MNTNVNAIAGPSRPLPRKSARPFVSADNRPSEPDGIFRVVLITSGSVASIKAPDIAAALSQSGDIALQIVATKSSTHFCNQQTVDAAIRKSLGVSEDENVPDDLGVRVWTDEDEWSDWKKVGEPILHIELRRWADLVVIAPCSANTLAKIAGGLCDNLATSLLRALSPSTPVIVCPAMNTHMYQHNFTAKHLRILQEQLEYLILGPQGSGILACGDDGPGKMTDWREIVFTIENFASMHKQKIDQSKMSAIPPQHHQPRQPQTADIRDGDGNANVNGQELDRSDRPKTPPTPGLPTSTILPAQFQNMTIGETNRGTPVSAVPPVEPQGNANETSIAHWKKMQNETYWQVRWWAG